MLWSPNMSPLIIYIIKTLFIMSNKKIFRELDLLISVRMTTSNKALIKIKEFLDNNNLPLNTPIGGTSEENIGDALLEILGALDQFLKEYLDIKDTWCVTTPSPALDDEK